MTKQDKNRSPPCKFRHPSILFLAKVFAPKLRWDWPDWMMWALLELGGLHGDGDADEEDAEHGDGGVPAPVHGPAVGPARHAPYLLPEVAASVAVPTMVAAHRRRRRRRLCCSDSIRSGWDASVVLWCGVGPDGELELGIVLWPCGHPFCTGDPADFANYIL